MKYACFTGHRKFQNINIEEVQMALLKLTKIALEDFSIEHFYCGMAIGADLLAASVLVSMKLPWTAVIPCLGQTDKWSWNCRKTYFELLNQSTSNVVLQQKYSPGCMNVRNAWMVNHSELLIAVWNERAVKGSGTTNTVNMAKKKRIPILVWNPETSEIKLLKPSKVTQLQLTFNF